MNRELFLSILALDSYNRGYGERMAGLGVSGRIGNATILTDALSRLDSAEVLRADFYAIAYEYEGDTIIAYRGTDELGKDAVNGYGVGAGFTGGLFAPQADLAVEFYTAVTGRPAFYITPPTDVTLVGHSLAGGLAGLVTMWTGAEARGYDHMLYGRAAALAGRGEAIYPFTSFDKNLLPVCAANDNYDREIVA